MVISLLSEGGTSALALAEGDAASIHKNARNRLHLALLMVVLRYFSFHSFQRFSIASRLSAHHSVFKKTVSAKCAVGISLRLLSGR
jgi:hypothetical protein